MAFRFQKLKNQIDNIKNIFAQFQSGIRNIFTSIFQFYNINLKKKKRKEKMLFIYITGVKKKTTIHDISQ